MHETLCDLLLDIVQNAVESDADQISVRFSETDGTTELEVKDNGRGMTAETKDKALSPFYSDGRKHAHRRFGFGLPFLMQTAEATGGTAEVVSTPGEGTTVRFRAPSDHVDLPPTGEFAGAAAMMMAMPMRGDLLIERALEGRQWSVARSQLVEALGELESAGSQQLMRTFLRSQEEDVRKAG